VKAVAGLAGDVDIDTTDFSDFDYPEFTSSFTDTVLESVFITTTVNITKAVNTVKINIRLQSTGTGTSTVRLRRGGLTGTILAGPSFVASVGGEVIFSVTDTNVPIGSIDYVATVQRLVVAHGVGLYTPNELPGIVVLSEADDTHAGIIDTIAVAGKNIITPDSHRTHETEVLP